MQRNNPNFKTANEIFHEQVAECFKKEKETEERKKVQAAADAAQKYVDECDAQKPFSQHHNFTMPKNNPNKIDTFWEAYNSSRCKTAMLCISILLIAGFIIAELSEIETMISSYIIIILGYWMGRTSKAKENKLKESGHSE